MPPRPKTVLVISAFLFAATAIAITVAIELLFPNRLLDWIWALNPGAAKTFHALGRIPGVMLLALAAGTFLAARGLLQRRRWAWWFAVALFALDASGNLISCFFTGDLLKSVSGAVISATFLTLLLRSKIRAHFAPAAA